VPISTFVDNRCRRDARWFVHDKPPVQARPLRLRHENPVFNRWRVVCWTCRVKRRSAYTPTIRAKLPAEILSGRGERITRLPYRQITRWQSKVVTKQRAEIVKVHGPFEIANTARVPSLDVPTPRNEFEVPFARKRVDAPSITSIDRIEQRKRSQS
jgi:hypothetical protein